MKEIGTVISVKGDSVVVEVQKRLPAEAVGAAADTYHSVETSLSSKL